MGTSPLMIRALAWVIIAIISMPPGLGAQETGTPEQVEKFAKEELAQMLAPIALYPDSLVAQILMASTYPLEVVEAERWVRENKDLKGEELDKALQDKSWDPSVKSLCHFPDILFALSNKLDQTRKLGDAFLSQEDDVMAGIQELRRRANEQGNLKSTEEQKVIVEQEIIRIEPADPQVVYVPVYDPLYVYGPWWYPSYPPYYWYYPSSFVITGGPVFFGPRFFVGLGFSWTWFDWRLNRIHIDRHKTRSFHRPRTRHDAGATFWRHEPRHRRGVAYRDRGVSERFGRRPDWVSPRSPEMRGYPPGHIERRRRTVAPPRSPVEIREGIGAPAIKPGRERIQRAPRRDTPFSGIGGGSFERKAGERGGESRRGGARGVPMRQPRSTIKQPAGAITPPSTIGPPGGGMRQPAGGVRQSPAGSFRGSGGGGGTRR